MGTLAVWSHGTLWLGFLLQVTLPVLLVRDKLASVLPVFTGLLLFYALRSFIRAGGPHASRGVWQTLQRPFAG